MATLFEKIRDAGIEYGNRCSDLQVKDGPEVREILEEHDKTVDGWNVQPFTNQITGERWLEIPFAYEPFWQNKGGSQ